MRASSSPIPWDRIDTVLVDMDGTLLDLAFDNYFWRELVPARFAELRGLAEEQARCELAERYRSVEGSLAWYCIDHWSRDLGLDIRALKWSHRHLISYLPRAPQFLSAVRSRGKRLLIVTNAHQGTVAVKVSQTQLDTYVDGMICSHDFLAPKESSEFWPRFHSRETFDPGRTLLIEDSLSVLEAARAFGLAFTVAIRRPDSGRPPRRVRGFAAVDGVAELVPLIGAASAALRPPAAFPARFGSA